MSTRFSDSLRLNPHLHCQCDLRFGDRVDADDIGEDRKERCAEAGGVNVHANVCVPARDRAWLERLCRYAARPPVATERLSRLPDGRLAYRLKRRLRDGTTHVLYEPTEFLARLAALIPPPRAHQLTYHGVLAPAAGLRRHIVPDGGPEPTCNQAVRPNGPRHPQPGEPACHPVPSSAPTGEQVAREPSRPAPEAGLGLSSSDASLQLRSHGPGGRRGRRRYSWVELLRRVLAVDGLACPRCGGRMQVVGVVESPEAIRAILDSLALASRPPPARPSRPEGREDQGLPAREPV